MHQKRSKKILLYFFLFLIIGTLNNKNLYNNNFGKVDEVIVVGLDDKNNLDIKNKLNFLKIDNLFFLKQIKINEILNSHSLIEKYTVFKRYPSTLKIKIDQTKFLAKTKKNNENLFLGANGKLVKIKDIKDIKENIPFIYGDFKSENFFNLKKVIDESNFDYDKIKILFSFKSGRWDIVTDTGFLIKLPKENLKKSLNIAINILANDNQKKIDEIDLRQYNQIIINGQ